MGMYAAYMCYSYFILKLTDYFDTIFFILRKKTAHVSFLHVYHHVAVSVGAYVCVLFATGLYHTHTPFQLVFVSFIYPFNFEYNSVFFFHFIWFDLCTRVRVRAVFYVFLGGQGILLGYLNTFVHAVMYTYYLLSIWKPEIKSSIAIKKNITRMQMVSKIQSMTKSRQEKKNRTKKRVFLSYFSGIFSVFFSLLMECACVYASSLEYKSTNLICFPLNLYL